MHLTKLFRQFWVILLLIFSGACCCSINHKNIETQPEELKVILRTFLKNELLKVWYPACIDSVNGGFLSDFNYNWTPEGRQDKMIVGQARHVWTASQAFLFFNDSSYYQIARHGFHFLKQKMWDTDFGGFYMILDSSGNDINNSYFDEKTSYGNSFAIYALASYYMISGDSSALQLAVETFKWLEEHSHDTVYKGYFDKMLRDGSLYTQSNSGITGIELKKNNGKIIILQSIFLKPSQGYMKYGPTAYCDNERWKYSNS